MIFDLKYLKVQLSNKSYLLALSDSEIDVLKRALRDYSFDLKHGLRNGYLPFPDAAKKTCIVIDDILNYFNYEDIYNF